MTKLTFKINQKAYMSQLNTIPLGFAVAPRRRLSSQFRHLTSYISPYSLFNRWYDNLKCFLISMCQNRGASKHIHRLEKIRGGESFIQRNRYLFHPQALHHLLRNGFRRESNGMP